jgi:hypothetical protein
MAEQTEKKNKANKEKVTLAARKALSEVDSMPGVEGIVHSAKRDRATGDLILAMDLDGHYISARINTYTKKVKGKIYHP